MTYALGSFVAGQTAGIGAAAIALFLARRQRIHLAYAGVAALLGGVFFILATPFGGASIDLRLGVILLGAYRNTPVGFDWGAVAAGAVAGVLLLTVPMLLAPERRARLLGPLLALTAVAYAVELQVARESTVNRRIELLSQLTEGLQHIVGREHHRVMVEPVPLIEDDSFVTSAVYAGLEVPTSIAFTPEGGMFVGLKAGRILHAKAAGEPLEQIHALEPIQAVSESGLLDLELHPTEPYLYAYYTVGGTSKNRLVRLKLEGARVTGSEIVLDDIPGFFMHNGGGMVFGPDGKLYVGTGTADYSSVAGDLAVPPGPQGWGSLTGKILRMDAKGGVPEDNPRPGSLAYARGVREVFRMTFDPLSGRLFATENGIGEHDEINVIYPGGNYGYPIHTGITGARGFEDPVLDIDKSIGITGFKFYRGEEYPSRYKDDVFFCSYVTGAIYWLPLDKQRNSRMPRGPVRAIRTTDPTMDCRVELEEGPDGLFYFSNEHGIYRLDRPADDAPKAERVVDGGELYKLYCAPCHQPAGTGGADQYPPLAGSEWVTGDESKLARILLFGLSGEITVKGKKYNGKMLPFGNVLDDEQLAALLTYIRGSWGNDAPAVSADRVRFERENGVALRLQ